jgi:hemerythrin-like domain-containing protein
MDIRDLLHNEHEQALRLMAQTVEAGFGPKARALLRELTQLLAEHHRAEEAVVYAALKKFDSRDLRDPAFEGDVEHSLIDGLLVALTDGRFNRMACSDTWQAHAKVAQDLLRQHVANEEALGFRALTRVFDATDRERLASRFLRLRRTAMPASAELATLSD